MLQDKSPTTILDTVLETNFPASDAAPTSKPDLVCFSHLRWDFVHQRPQHLLSRCARDRRVFFVEEPLFDNGSMHLDIAERAGGLKLVTPHLPAGLQSNVAVTAVLKDMVHRLLLEQEIE